MKKFILFQFDQYYPGGGLGDITGSFDTLEDAKAKTKNDIYPADYNYVVDRDTWEEVWNGDGE